MAGQRVPERWVIAEFCCGILGCGDIQNEEPRQDGKGERLGLRLWRRRAKGRHCRVLPAIRPKRSKTAGAPGGQARGFAGFVFACRFDEDLGALAE